MAQNKLSAQDVLDKAEELSFPKSVVEFMQGSIGQPYQGFPEPLRSKVRLFVISYAIIELNILVMFIRCWIRSQVLKGLTPIEGRPGESLTPLDFEATKRDLVGQFGSKVRDQDVMSYAMYPQVATEFFDFRSEFGPVDKLATRIFLTGPKVGETFDVTIEKGKTLSFKTLAVAADLTPNGEREVFFELNGQLRSVFISDKTATKVRFSYKFTVLKIAVFILGSLLTALIFFRNYISTLKRIRKIKAK